MGSDEPIQNKATQQANGVEFTTPLNPNSDPASARALHSQALPGGVYAHALHPLVRRLFGNSDIGQSALVYFQDLVERMAPQDPVEEMMVGQFVMAHVRTLSLTEKASRAVELNDVRILNEYADRASNTYRRLMLALAEYRRPPRGPASVTAIQQANIGAQQVVVNGQVDQAKNTTNEQGGPDDNPARESNEVLPAHLGGAGVPACFGEAREAVGEVHRASNG